DLFLIHWPVPHGPDDYVETWRTLETFKRDGRARSIGVSNFQVEHLERLDSAPAVHQIELHPDFLNAQGEAYGRHHGIPHGAGSRIAQGWVLADPEITTIAERLDRSPAQVVLRWHLQRGTIVFPKSNTPSRIEENFALFDFELTGEDLQKISKLDRGESGRTGEHPDRFGA